MDDALIGAVVHVGKERQPIFWHFVARNGESVVLGGHEAPARPRVQTRLIVAAISIPKEIQITSEINKTVILNNLLHLEGGAASSNGQQLVAKANAKDWLHNGAGAHQFPQVVDQLFAQLRVARTVAQEQRIKAVLKH